MKHFSNKNQEIDNNKINQQKEMQKLMNVELTSTNNPYLSKKIVDTTTTLQKLYEKYQHDDTQNDVENETETDNLKQNIEYETDPETIERFQDQINDTQLIETQKETDEFNIENIKNDLENYLDSQNQQNFTIDQQYKNSNFGDEKTNLSNQYDTTFFEQSQEKNKDPKGNLYEKAKKTKLDSCNTQNKLRYEEWVYKDENTMNGKELFDGIYAYDNMVDNFCSFGNNAQIISK